MLGRISQLLKWGVARFADASGARLLRPGGEVVSVPMVLPFPDLQPSILASFVAGTTAAQAGNTVTVTAAAHGIVGSTARNGYRIYYPGSPSIPAGWYGGFAWVDANTVNFQRDVSATVPSESVNSGAAMLSTVTIASCTIPADSIGAGGRVTVSLHRTGDSAVTSKTLRIAMGGALLGMDQRTSTPSASIGMSFRNVSTASQVAQPAADGVGTGNAPYSGAVDTTAPQTLSITGVVASASSWLAVLGADCTVVKQ